MTLTPDQKEAYNNIFGESTSSIILGPAGTGKSFLIKFIKSECERKHIKCAITSTTWASAEKIGGITIHSLFKTIDGRGKPDYKKLKGLKEYKYIIIDEVSMLTDTMLEYIYKVWTYFGRTFKIIFLGDFFQLAPRGKFAFESPYWDAFGFYITELLFPCRQRALEHYYNLLRARFGDTSCIEYFIYNDPGIINSRFYTAVRNEDVTRWNRKIVDKLSGKAYIYNAEGPDYARYDNGVFDQHLYLKLGTYVKFIASDISHSKVFKNGQTGIIKTLDDNYIEVLNLSNNTIIPLYRMDFSTPCIYDKRESTTISQYPVRPLYGQTLNKMQGATLDKLNFETSFLNHHAQAYIGLSRVRTPGGLHLIGNLGPENFVIDKRVLAFCEKYGLVTDPNMIIKRIAA